MNDLILVRLSKEQIDTAKALHGGRSRITHALICGEHGRLFGTEKHCRKYYSAWKDIFRSLFSTVYETELYDIDDYESTPELVIKLLEEHDKLECSNMVK